MTNLDAIGHKILHELARDGRQSNLDLADRVGLSPSACLRRVQEMERRGLIRGYRAVFDHGQLGIGFVAYVAVGLAHHTKQDQEGFEIAIAQAAEVRECHNVTGAFEYILRVEAADLAAYKHFHTEVLGVLPQVSSITTYVVMGSPKDERA
jgi:DNA-binding Lrp family transcriptional regulator